jgi:hypothetical protein
LRQHPTLVIGRKGAGKTAFLHGGHQDQDYNLVIDLNSASAFATIVRLIQSSMGADSLYVEPVAKLWEMTFWLALMFSAKTALTGTYQLTPFIGKDVKASLDSYTDLLDPAPNHTAAQFIVTALQFYKAKAFEAQCQPEDIPDFIVSFELNGPSFAQVKQLLCVEMEKRNRHALLTIDSLDTRIDPGDKYDIAKNEANMALTGLLKCLGSFSENSKIYHARFCLPSERYFQFLDLSSNPAKDMVNEAVLNWNAGELICIAAHRLALFLDQHVEFHGHYTSRLSKMNPSKKGHAVQILQSVLEHKTVQNRLNETENTISYIIRHTQLLPRHLLLILNSIFSAEKENGGSFLKIREDSVREGVRRVEETICHEVFAAYRHTYPRAPEVCAACIPELSLRFGHGDLHKVFNEQGKRTLASNDYDEFKRMFIEMGIIGKVVTVTERYIEAQFEYAMGHRMVIGSSDDMCLHPVFSQIYSAKLNDDAKVIYPYGSDVEATEQS